MDTIPDERIARFRTALGANSFAGTLETTPGAREVAATDNSIYHVRPAAIVYPRVADDINRIVRAAIADPGKPLPLCPRGGNTGTNGQSLSAGVVVDFARHMNAIISIDADRDGGTVTVEPGVVLDQLNAVLAEHGLFFPPMVSTASRATIGGMVATDASGKGSRRYGKTSDYIERLDVVLATGEDWSVVPMTMGAAEAIGRQPGIVGDLHRVAVRVARDNADEIARVFPDMNRGLTGYNLQKLYQAREDRFFLGPLLAGSEGTLAITKAITLRVVPRPRAKALAVIRYHSFDSGLRDVDRLLGADPVAIEIIDDNVLSVAKSDIIWNSIAAVLGDDSALPTRAISFIEFAGQPEEVEAGLDHLARLNVNPPSAQIDAKIVRDPQTIAGLWKLREKSVGLLARLGGGRQGIPFVEDTAVPPHRLADFVDQFRQVLDRHGLKYGMFGHADVGCLHVRPFVDMQDAGQAALIRPISDEVAALTKTHGGLLWGEHGRGFRGEYSPFFFGPTLYAELERIKRSFDPHDILNPGKLARADATRKIDRIDAVPFRGSLDSRIAAPLRDEFERAAACNGNAACFSWDALDAMCPSYKATRDRAQSPKGRAALLRTWARLATSPSHEPTDNDEFAEIEAATARSLATCLSCKACTTQCPVNVDIPTMKSRFNERYHARHRRPLRHHLLARLETLLAMARAVPGFANLFAQSRIVGWACAKFAGFMDLPAFAPARRSALPPIAIAGTLRALSPAQRSRTVILVEDSFTASFDGAVIEAATAVLRKLDYNVFRLPAQPNGKALHMLGMRTRFAAIARQWVVELESMAATGATLVGMDQAIALMAELEYREFAATDVRIIGLEEILLRDLSAYPLPPGPDRARPFRLFGHCTENAIRPGAMANWQTVFRQFGAELTPIRSGCCGMAGMFGHETQNQAMSKTLFDLSWASALGDDYNLILATGFSCRCQTKRFAGFRPRHPIEALHAKLCAA